MMDALCNKDFRKQKGEYSATRLLSYFGCFKEYVQLILPLGRAQHAAA